MGKNGPKMKISDLLRNFQTSQFRGTEYEFDIDISRFYNKNLFLGQLVPNIKLYQIYLKTCPQEIWKALNADLTWSSDTTFY